MSKQFQIACVVMTVMMAVFLYPKVVLAHPGRTASDGCHYCRTNCSKWGEIEGARHCHGGGVVAPIIPKSKPSSKLVYPSPTPSPRVARSPSPIPQVKGSSSSEDVTDSNDNLLLYSIIGMLSVWIYKLKNNRKSAPVSKTKSDLSEWLESYQDELDKPKK